MFRSKTSLLYRIRSDWCLPSQHQTAYLTSQAVCALNVPITAVPSRDRELASVPITTPLQTTPYWTIYKIPNLFVIQNSSTNMASIFLTPPIHSVPWMGPDLPALLACILAPPKNCLARTVIPNSVSWPKSYPRSTTMRAQQGENILKHS